MTPRRARQTPSERQTAILRFVYDFQQANGFAPSIREIGKQCDISSTSVVDYNLRRLEELGYIERSQEKSRAIRLTEKALEWLGVAPEVDEGFVYVPLVGEIAAGLPIPQPDEMPPEQAIEERVPIQADLLPRYDPNRLFALRVKGDSMIDALVADGDIVVLEPVDEPHNGEMVAAWLPEENEATLKYFERIAPPAPALAPSAVDDVAQPDPDETLEHAPRPWVRLIPANPRYTPLELPADKVQIAGRVVALLRVYR
ncbi:MAG: repressor LexA [Ardenticatenia bacterium]|nr:MAG: repressor LexA [Ardenticatenia bacterium]